jgi:NAD+ synthase (glutamine-hydrolysing)
MRTLRVAGAQLNLTVGDIAANVLLLRDAMDWAEAEDADVLLFPEMAICGYPPEDLVLREGFTAANLAAIEELASHSRETLVVVGFVNHAADTDDIPDDAASRTVANAAAILHQGAVVGVYHKVLLPNYGVFDEARYFSRGGQPAQVWDALGLRLGISVCEDIWISDGPPAQQAAAGADVLLNINASPFSYGKAVAREDLLRAQARAAGVPIVYVNQVGGQDELVFDGCSMVFSSDGTLLHRSPQFVSDTFIVDIPLRGGEASATLSPLLSNEEEVYRALVTGIGDYVHKNGFSHVIIGLSGGIDSALTAVICADALGPEAVLGITMPSRYSSGGSVSDSRDLAERIGIRFESLPIEDIFASYLTTLAPLFADVASNVAEENLQARIRGALLMAMSNKFGGMVVATGNKSEMAVGYATLYGDMAGGYSVLKDVFKTLVYDLARWRNGPGVQAFGGNVPPIPKETITKPPSAELAPNQKDSDSLPDYGLLDAILERYIEEDRSAESILDEGFDAVVVQQIVRLVDRNEYKRRQAAPGVKITAKAFGKDRRLPITNRYHQ